MGGLLLLRLLVDRYVVVVDDLDQVVAPGFYLAATSKRSTQVMRFVAEFPIALVWQAQAGREGLKMFREVLGRVPQSVGCHGLAQVLNLDRAA